jgi:hypothetical protein
MKAQNHIIHEWTQQELKRKQTHSQIEKKRRQRIQNQIVALSKLVPNLPPESEKLDVLKSTTEYIKQLQDCLSKYKDDPKVRQYLPIKKTTLDLLLPNYIPFSTINKSPSPGPQTIPKMDIQFLIN